MKETLLSRQPEVVSKVSCEFSRFLKDERGWVTHRMKEWETATSERKLEMLEEDKWGMRFIFSAGGAVVPASLVVRAGVENLSVTLSAALLGGLAGLGFSEFTNRSARRNIQKEIERELVRMQRGGHEEKEKG